MVGSPEKVETKDLLTKDNYKFWLEEIDLLLSVNGVDDFIYKEKIRSIDKSKIKKENISNYTKVKKKKKKKIFMIWVLLWR